MGLWPELEDVLEAPPRRTNKKPVPVFDPTRRGCDNCALKETWRVITTPKMALSGNTKDAEVLVLAEAPGEVEDMKGMALIGPAGQQVRDFIPQREVHRLAFQNAVRCRPDNNRTPTIEEVHNCGEHLDADIARLPHLKAILGLGAVPLRKYFPGASIMRVHGLKFPIRVGKHTLWYYPVMHPAYILHSKQESKYDSPALPVFRADVRNFFKDFDYWDKPKVYNIEASQVILPKTRQEAESYIKQMTPPFGIDIETHSKFKGVPRPYEIGAQWLTAGISDGKTTIAFPCNHPLAPTGWGVDLVLQVVTEHEWVAHNAAYELAWLTYYNKTGKPIKQFGDSQALVRLKHERESAIDLGVSSHIHLGVDVKRLVPIDTDRIIVYPLEEVLPYNGLDALACILIHNKLRKDTDEKGYQRIIGSIEATCRMELEGLPTDHAASVELRGHWIKRQEEIRVAASRLYEVRSYEADRGIAFNIAAPEQVGAALVAYGKLDLPMTAGGKQYSTDDKIIGKYADTNPLAKKTQEFREASKLISYTDPVLEAPKRFADGLLHPTYTTMIVSTLRLSSRDPNIQNWPSRKHKELRRQIAVLRDEMIRRYGKALLMVKFDYGQLEARVLAMASKDKLLCGSIIDHFDIHTHWLNVILDEFFPDYLDRLAEATGQTEETKIRKAGRDIIKSDLVFNALYGGGVDEISNLTSIPLETVIKIIARFWQNYKGVKDWHHERRNEYRDTGAIKTLTNRVRRGIMTGNEPINTPIQGTAADIVIEAMNEIAALARRNKDIFLHPRINIHDDLTFLVPEDELEDYIDVIHPILTKVRFPWQCVPLTAEVSIGDNWASMHPVYTFEGSYNR